MSRTRILGPRLLQPPTQPSTTFGTSPSLTPSPTTSAVDHLEVTISGRRVDGAPSKGETGAQQKRTAPACRYPGAGQAGAHAISLFRQERLSDPLEGALPELTARLEHHDDISTRSIIGPLVHGHFGKKATPGYGVDVVELAVDELLARLPPNAGRDRHRQMLQALCDEISRNNTTWRYHDDRPSETHQHT